ncbi:MAG: glycosyltransferase [Gammaproteobacteria bacterium]
MSKPRVMYVLRQYPQVSETYVQTEIDAVSEDFEVIVIALNDAAKIGNTAYQQHNPYLVINDIGQLQNAVRMFRPQVLHTHWMISAPLVYRLAKTLNVPFTVRAHSFDTLPSEGPRLADWRKTAPQVIPQTTRDPLCLGVLAFPFSRPFFESNGADMSKLIDCYPCVDFKRFYDPSPNGDAIMNVGACIPKKRMEDFLELGASMPERRFDIYPVSYQTEQLAARNQAMGSPVNIHAPVEPAKMPAEYKKHRWLVYTADWQINAIGWPLSVAEAQASGTGVLLPAVRPDIEQYLGGAGYAYRSLQEAREIISGEVPATMREAGFGNAKRSDVYEHRRLLTELWARAAA